MARINNLVILHGHVGSDPESQFIASGRCRCTFSVATNADYKPQGATEWVKQTHWHRITVWGPLAESVSQQVKKGNAVLIVGESVTRSYDANKTPGGAQDLRYVTEVVASSVGLAITPARRDGGAGGGAPAAGHGGGGGAPAGADAAPAGADAAPPTGDEDIPF